MAKYFLIFIICFTVYHLNAQDKINTDRPDATESATLTLHHYFQAELGIGKENFGNNNYDLVIPTALFKYGLTKNFELRLEANFLKQYRQLIPDPQTINGFEPVTIGFRTGLIQQKKLLPQTALIASVGIPAFSSKVFRTKHLAPEIVLSMQNDVTKNFGIGYNVGAVWDGVNTSPAWLYTLSCAFELNKNWDAFIEVFGSAVNNETPQNSIDAGIGYYINNNVRLDASAGLGISNAAAHNFFGVGVSFRFK